VVAALAVACGALPSAADELVLDMEDLPSLSGCVNEFVLSGRDCRTQELTAPPACQVDDRPNGTLFLGYAILVVDPGELSSITQVVAVAETIRQEVGSTVLGVYAGEDEVASVANEVFNEIEELVLDTTGLVFDTIRVSGYLLELHELRIESPDVPLENPTWSAVKAAYR
jgi:hypothetical protein